MSQNIHNICNGCKWENYPECNGTVLEDGSNMPIDNLRDSFQCGIKDRDIPKVFSHPISKIEELENRIKILESS